MKDSKSKALEKKKQGYRRLINSNTDLVEGLAKKPIYDVTSYKKEGGFKAKSGSPASVKRMMDVRERLRQKFVALQ